MKEMKFHTKQEIAKAIKEDIKKNYRPVLLCILVFIVLETIVHEVCFTKLMFGIPCPACGLTRASIAFMKGNLCLALSYHPMLPMVILGVILFLFSRYVLINDCKWIKVYGIIFVVLLVLCYIYRMITMYPAVVPMDYNEKNWLHWIGNIIRKV